MLVRNQLTLVFLGGLLLGVILLFGPILTVGLVISILDFRILLSRKINKVMFVLDRYRLV